MTTSGRHLERLLQIDTFLRSGQRHTATNMAELLGVTERTVRKDIDFMRDRFGAPISSTKVKGYYYTEPDWRLPTIPLSEGELFALALGARMLSAYAGSIYQSQLESAIARLAERLPEQTWVDLQELAQQSVLVRVGAELDLNPEIWQQLEQACKDRRQVQIQYFTAGRNTESERVLDPYLLHFTRNNPCVTGFCHVRQTVRDFRVDRIRKLVVLPSQFETDPKFDPKAYFEGAFQHELSGEMQDIAIWFDAPTAPYICERRWHPSQTIDKHPDGSITLRFVVRGLNEVKRWVLYYGKSAKVVSPPQLMAMVQEEIEGMQQNYRGSKE